jgi:hypothetical protein
MKKGPFIIFLSLFMMITKSGLSQGVTPEEWGLKALKIAHETLNYKDFLFGLSSNSSQFSSIPTPLHPEIRLSHLKRQGQ